jgi:N-acyl-D-aspartate/D-glutamate deacylase
MSAKHVSIVAATLAVALGMLGAGSAARADVSIIDNNKTLDVDCAKDPEISLVGNNIKVTAKGVCAKITVSGNHETVTGSATVVFVAGNHNTVTLAAADDITIAGNSNTVTVRKSLKLPAPKIANSGTDNHITQPK